jgi:DNA-binding PadR family transcriptional regulator
LVEENAELTDLEGHVLAYFAAGRADSAYKVMRIFQTSPVSGLSGSSGAIYPIVKRLRKRGLLAAEPVEQSARKAERVTCTQAGHEAARRWVLTLRPADFFPVDPLRTKLSFLSLASSQEQLGWLCAASESIVERLAEIDQYGQGRSGIHDSLALDGARRTLQARHAWLQAAIVDLFGGKA